MNKIVTCLLTVADLGILALNAVAHGGEFIVEAVKARRLLVEEGVVFVDKHHAHLVGGDRGCLTVDGKRGVWSGGSHIVILYMYNERVG